MNTKIGAAYPVEYGTEVEVTCSEVGQLNSGSSWVTCNGGTSFTTAGTQPDCTRVAGTGSKLWVENTIIYEIKQYIYNEA